MKIKFPKKKNILIGAGLACLMLLFGVLTVFQEMSRFANTPANKALKREARYFYYTVKPGSSLDRVSADLAGEGALSDAVRFKLLALWKGGASSIKAGEFEFNTAWTPLQVLDQLVSGRPLLHRVTIPEGLPWWEVGALLEKHGFAKASDFAALVNDKELVRRCGIPFDNAEGFLYPETYMLSKGREPNREHALSAFNAMIRTFWRQTGPLWAELQATEGPRLFPGSGAPEAGPEAAPPGREYASFVPQYARENPEEVKRLVLLASLVEKESAAPDERPRIAGVYGNRLRIKMPLQCDPTIIYGLGPDFGGRILRSHLMDEKNPYNTYKYYGLPPGPICSPGLESIRAAFYPEIHNYLYFVATGQSDGRHSFSATLREHNEAVRRYRAALRAR